MFIIIFLSSWLLFELGAHHSPPSRKTQFADSFFASGLACSLVPCSEVPMVSVGLGGVQVYIGFFEVVMFSEAVMCAEGVNQDPMK